MTPETAIDVGEPGRHARRVNAGTRSSPRPTAAGSAATSNSAPWGRLPSCVAVSPAYALSRAMPWRCPRDLPINDSTTGV